MGLEVFIPDIVVGIDFGMTVSAAVFFNILSHSLQSFSYVREAEPAAQCTGVAYSMAPEWAAPTAIQHWPGRLGHENRNKVTTAIAYDPRTGKPVTWGFLVDQETRDLEVQELFKLYLDPAHRDEDYREQPSLQEARRWFSDYLRCIYQTIKEHFDETYPRWTTKNVEFLFSVPTTWKNPAMIAETERLIKQAGYGERTNHLVRISLTEAEAAAVCASKQSYDSGDVFLVCDAGGGTTDVNVLKVRVANLGQTELEPLSWVEGQAIGSTIIDFKMEKLMVERLERIRHHLPEEPRVLAEKMMTDRFETFKCSFGSEVMNVFDLSLPIPGMPGGMDFPQSNVQDSKMIIAKQEMQKVFDEQIEKMFRLIDDQLRKLQTSHPRESISYLVLSGGFGSSPYLKQRMRKRYELGAGTNLPNAQDIKILLAREPQLVVVHGIVIDRCQELRQGTGVYKERCCRSSYGIVIRQPLRSDRSSRGRCGGRP